MRAKDAIRLVISVTIIALFSYAYARNPSDDLLIGALIAQSATIINWWLVTSLASNDKIAPIDRMYEQASGKPYDPVHISEDTQ